MVYKIYRLCKSPPCAQLPPQSGLCSAYAGPTRRLPLRPSASRLPRRGPPVGLGRAGPSPGGACATRSTRRCGLGQQRQTEHQQRQAAALRRHDDGEGVRSARGEAAKEIGGAVQRRRTECEQVGHGDSVTGGRRETSGAHARWTEALFMKTLCGWAVGLAHVPQSGPHRRAGPGTPGSVHQPRRARRPAAAVCSRPVSGRVYPGNRPISTRAHSLSAWTLGASVEPGACPWSAASARLVAACATIADRPVRVAWARAVAHRRAVSGPLRPPACGCEPVPGGAYAVPRRTRRRAGAVRGAAVPAGWGRRRAGTACACCARYSTSWSPASSNSCSWMML